MSKSVLLSPRTHHVNDLTSAAVVRFSGEEHDTAGLSCSAIQLAPDETVILLHPPLPLVGESIVMERERQQNDSLVNGYIQQPERRAGQGGIMILASRHGYHDTKATETWRAA